MVIRSTILMKMSCLEQVQVLRSKGVNYRITQRK